MRLGYVLLALAVASPAIAQHKREESCSVSAGVRAQVERYLALALPAAKKAKYESTRSELLEEIAGLHVCLGDLREAAEIGDLAYPSGSKSMFLLGRATVTSGKLGDVPVLERSMTHGTDSFLAGVVEGLALQGKAAEAEGYMAKIPAPEVRDDARGEFIQGLYRAGKKDEAYKLVAERFATMNAKDKGENSLEAMELEVAADAGDWPEVKRLLALLPEAPEKRYIAASVAAEEAEAGFAGGHADLLAAAAKFDAKSDLAFEGYILASHLAGVHDFDAAKKMAEAVRDDEWNAKSWTSVASFQAEAGDMDGARASIAKIGVGDLEHKLDHGPLARDMAREFVAAGLTRQGHPATALALLAEHESTDDFSGELLLEEVYAIAVSGELAKATGIVDKELAGSITIGDPQRRMAVTLVRVMYQSSPVAAEAWTRTQKSDEVRAAAWIGLASEAAGKTIDARHYFANWD